MKQCTSAQQLQIFRSSRELLRHRIQLQKEGKLWEQFSRELSTHGLPEMRIKGIIAALHQYLATTTPPHRLRILHPMEHELISTDAWGVLLEAISLGMVDKEDAEVILEQVAQRSRLPIGRDHLELGLANRWHSRLSQNSPPGLIPS